MSTYELAVLVRKEADLENVKKLLSSANATIEKEDAWGKRELAYPIKKETQAYYYFLDVTVDGGAIEELKQKMNFDEKVLRYLLLTRD
ncbi:MAG: 30S ribosomal protein S6 [Patescibacteria group bacterium]